MENPAPGARAFARDCWAQLVDPTVLTLPVVAPVFWVARRLDLIASTPIWILCGLLVVAFLASCVTTALWGEHDDGWRLWARVAVQIFGITAVMYAIGWGPMLAIGLDLRRGRGHPAVGLARRRCPRWC